MNEKRTNPANPALNISEVYHVLFRHKWKILAIWVLGVIATGVIWFGIPTPYQSEAKLLVRYVEEHKSPGAAVNDSSIQTLGFGSGSAINNEILTLTSLDLAQQVADSVGPERILAKIGGGTNRLQAAAVVRSGLTPEILPGSTVIRVVFKHADRDVVQPVLAQLVDSYLKEHGKIHQGLGTLEDALRQQKDTLGSELRATERDLRAAKTNAGVISQEDAKHYNEQLFKIREELFRAEAELAEHQATLDAMTNTVPTTNSSLAVQPSNAPPDVVDEYKRICNQLETQEKYEQDLLAQRMKPENAFVQLARK
jgi:uncharacterized protein involved in exopolysaccharide biosynthesis